MSIAEVYRSRILAFLSTIFISLLITGCLADDTSSELSSPAADVTSQMPSAVPGRTLYPGIQAPTLQIQGSNTIGASLAPALAKEFLLSLGVQNVRLTNSADNEKSISGIMPDGRPIRIHIAAHGSSTGFTALHKNQADIAAASRPIKATEAESLAFLGDLTSVEGEHVLAIDGLAIIVHPEVALDKLSLEQLRGIFSGAIADWRELGISPAPIKVFARDNNSGTYDTFKHLVLTGNAQLTNTAQRYESNNELAQAVAKTPGAIGFVALASAQGGKVLGISDGEAVALRPDQVAVATEDYPLSRRLYLYSETQDLNPLAADFIEYVLSTPGQRIVEKEGFISQAPKAYDIEPAESDPANFTRLTRGAQRLSLNFRFRPDSWELDTKAYRDVQRLADFMHQSNIAPSRLMLIGFSEKRRGELGAQILSEHRATAVQKALEEKGISTKAVTGYGHYRAVASAQSLQASLRNNRVEVWLMPIGSEKR